MDKEYIKADIQTTTQGAEALAALLPALGVAGYCVEDPSDLDSVIAAGDKLMWDIADAPFEPGRGKGEVHVIFWIKNDGDFAEATIKELRGKLSRLKSEEENGMYGEGVFFGPLRLDTELVTDDWKDKYKENFHAFSPCKGIVIAPPWEAVNVDDGMGPDFILIIIDPGMAFGTGSHETTTMCLERLKTLLKPGDSLLDAGTGSGILSIAAALFGAGKIHAIEIDADAVSSAAANIGTNGVADKIVLINGDIAAEGVLPKNASYDLITANLTCSLLEELLPLFISVLSDKGSMILSGLLDAQEERALDMANANGLNVVDIKRSGEWLMLEVQK